MAEAGPKKARLKRDDRELRTPAALLPYQQRWVADAAPVKVYEKSRRVGISWADAADSALLAAAKSGMDCWYIGYNKDMSLEYIQDCGDWAKHFHKAASAVEEITLKEEGADGKDIQAFRVKFASGHKVVALSSRPRNLRGKQGKIVIDEAAFHDDLPGLLKAALAMLIWGGRVAVISSHNGDDSPFNELILDIRAGKKNYSLHRTTLDDALAEGLYERICLKLGRAWTAEGQETWRQELIDLYGEGADEELFCVPSSSAGAYLSRALIESCMDAAIPVLRWGCKDEFARQPQHIREAETHDWLTEYVSPCLEVLPAGRPSYFGEDFGRSGDLTVIWPIQEGQTLQCHTPFVVELRNVPFEQQRQILFFIVDRLPLFRGGALDARGNGQYLAEVAMQKYGEGRISQIMPTNAFYLDYMPKYKAALEDHTIDLPRDGDILDDHRALRVERGIPKVPEGKKNQGRDGGQRHGDSAIAGCMANAARVLTPYQPITYETVQPRRWGASKGAW